MFLNVQVPNLKSQISNLKLKFYKLAQYLLPFGKAGMGFYAIQISNLKAQILNLKLKLKLKLKFYKLAQYLLPFGKAGMGFSAIKLQIPDSRFQIRGFNKFYTCPYRFVSSTISSQNLRWHRPREQRDLR